MLSADMAQERKGWMENRSGAPAVQRRKTIFVNKTNKVLCLRYVVLDRKLVEIP